MLKKKTINLLEKNKDFNSIFSVCIGKSWLYQHRFKDYLGKYRSWNTDITKGILTLDDRTFSVEFIGTTVKWDNYWCSAEMEKRIPEAYIKLMKETRKVLESLSIPLLTEKKILIDDNVNSHNLSMIYIAFAPQNVTYFCGSGDTSIFMFVKNLPDDIFRKMEPREFVVGIPEILSNFYVDHRLMIQGLLNENNIEYQMDENSIVAKFNENAIITISFDEKDFITGISGNL